MRHRLPHDGAFAVLLAGVFVVLGAGDPAGAGTITVTYEVESGQIDCCPVGEGGLVDVVSGQFTARLPAVGPSTLSDAFSIYLLSLELVGHTATTGGDPANRGLKLRSPAVLSVSLFSTPTPHFSILQFNPFVASFYGGRSFSLGPNPYVALSLGGVVRGGVGGPTGSIGFTLYYMTESYSGGYARVFASGREVARVYAPEPPRAQFVAFALVALAAARLVARRRRSLGG